MKFLFVVRNPSFFLHYEKVIRWLRARDHRFICLLDSMVWRNAELDAKTLDDYRDETGGAFDFKPAIKPEGLGSRVLKHKREIINYAAYVRESHPISTSPFMIERSANSLYPPMHILMRNRMLKRFVFRKERVGLLRALERLIPPDKAIGELIRRINPDLVVASPYLFAHSGETEYVKCAKALGIPTAVAVFSWDNLTSKGVFQIMPDAVLVWNRAQIEELTEIHKVPEQRAIWTGAPSMDFWFELRPPTSRQEFCVRHGLDPDRPFIVYLCSSQTIAKDENVPVTELVRYMQSKLGSACPSVLIRPHPLNSKIWDGFEMPGVVIVPRSTNDIFYSSEAKALFHETVYHARCIVGLNTTAMIEAIIVDRPAITLVSERYAATQEQSGHFHHLSDAGFFAVCRTFEQFTNQVARVLGGEDPFREARRRFIGDFVRPWGWDYPSAEIMGLALERLAAGESAAGALQCIRKNFVGEDSA